MATYRKMLMDKDGNNIIPITNYDQYSTTEQDTGKTWIDGRKIYRKVVTKANPTSTAQTTVSHGISGAKMFISCTAFVSSNGGTTFYPYNPNFNFQVVNVTSTEITFTGNSGFNNWTIYFVLEYVKS